MRKEVEKLGHCWQDGGSEYCINARNEYYATHRNNATVATDSVEMDAGITKRSGRTDAESEKQENSRNGLVGEDAHPQGLRNAVNRVDCRKNGKRNYIDAKIHASNFIALRFINSFARSSTFKELNRVLLKYQVIDAYGIHTQLNIDGKNQHICA